MDFLLSYLRQSWGSAFLWLTILGTAGYAITSPLREKHEQKKLAWKKRVQDSIAASASSPTDQPITPYTVKTSTATWIILVLILILPAIGYGVGIHLQSKRDAKEIAERFAKYDAAYASWQRTWIAWQIKHPQENSNAGRPETRRRIPAAASTPASTGATASESSAIRRIALNR